MGTTEHEEPRFFFILNKGAKSGGEITHAVLNGSIVSKPAGWDADLLQIYTIPTLKQKKRGKTPKVWGLIYF